MAGLGRAPKENLSRERDQARRDASTTKVKADGVLRGKPLPNDIAWHPRTKAWWQSWRTSPLAQTFTDGDWDFLLDTALLHSEMWNGETKLAAEIRLRVSAFGSTPEARLRLRLKIDEEATEVAQTVNMDAERRKRLKAIAD
jgi:hypothetical protein